MDIKVEPKLETGEEPVVGEFDFPPLLTTEEPLTPNMPTPQRQSTVAETEKQKPQVARVKSEKPYHLNIKSDDTVTCPKCKLEFSGLTGLKHHWTRKHHGLKMKQESVDLSCPVCSKEMHTLHHYNRHMLSHRTSMECDECGSESHTFRDRGSLKRHLIVIHRHRIYAPDSHYAKTYTCQTCLKEFKIRGTYKLHLRIHMQDRPMYQCTECPSKLATRASHYSHMRNAHFDSPHLQCDICGVVMKAHYLPQHKKLRHEMKEIYSCSECPATFSGKPSFLKHCSEHKTGKLNCQFCNEVLKNGASRISHERHNHYEEFRRMRPLKSKETMICDQCDKPCKGREIFKTHLLFVHTNKYSFLCDICGWKFKLRSQLTNHLLRHQGRFIFYCDDCGHAWKSREGLFKHSMKHHLGKPNKTKCELEMQKSVDETVRYAMQGLYDDHNKYFDSDSDSETEEKTKEGGLSILRPNIPAKKSPYTSNPKGNIPAAPSTVEIKGQQQRQPHSVDPLRPTSVPKSETQETTSKTPSVNTLLPTVSPNKFPHNSFAGIKLENSSIIPGIVVRTNDGTSYNDKPAEPVQIRMTSIQPVNVSPSKFRRKGLVPLAPKIPISNQPIQMSQMTQFRNTNSVPQAQIPTGQLFILSQPTQVQYAQNSSGALPILQKRPDLADQMPISIKRDHDTAEKNNDNGCHETPTYNGMDNKSVENYDPIYALPSMLSDKSYAEQLVAETCENEISAREFAEKLVEQDIAEEAARYANRTLPVEIQTADGRSLDESQSMSNVNQATYFNGTYYATPNIRVNSGKYFQSTKYATLGKAGPMRSRVFAKKGTVPYLKPSLSPVSKYGSTSVDLRTSQSEATNPTLDRLGPGSMLRQIYLDRIYNQVQNGHNKINNNNDNQKVHIHSYSSGQAYLRSRLFNQKQTDKSPTGKPSNQQLDIGKGFDRFNNVWQGPIRTADKVAINSIKKGRNQTVTSQLGRFHDWNTEDWDKVTETISTENTMKHSRASLPHQNILSSTSVRNSAGNEQSPKGGAIRHQKPLPLMSLSRSDGQQSKASALGVQHSQGSTGRRADTMLQSHQSSISDVGSKRDSDSVVRIRSAPYQIRFVSSQLKPSRRKQMLP